MAPKAGSEELGRLYTLCTSCHLMHKNPPDIGKSTDAKPLVLLCMKVQISTKILGICPISRNVVYLFPEHT